MLEPSVRDRILSLISNRALRPGARLPSSRKIAQELGLGRTAVNNAIIRLIGDGTLRQEGYRTYVGNGPETTRAPLPPIDFFTFQDEGKQTVIDIAARWGFNVRVWNSDDDNLYRRDLLKLEHLRTSGALLRRSTNADILERFEKHGIPVFVFGMPWPGHSFVAPQAAPIVSTAVNHLVNLGHRRLAYLSLPPDFTYPPLRLEVELSYPEACSIAGIGKENGHFFVLGGDDPTSIRRSWREIQKLSPRPTGILCESIRMVAGIYEIAAESAQSVPSDFSVICLFENDAAARTEPPTTAIGVDQSEILSVATLLLIREIERREHHPGRRRFQPVFCEPGLIERGSTGPAPKVFQAELDNGFSRKEIKAPRWSDDVRERKAQAAAINRVQLRLPGTSAHRKFCQIQIPAEFKREFSRRNSWLGRDPLKNLGTGLQNIHGVPFLIEDRAVILRSQHARATSRVPLPDAAVVPVNCLASAICILQAAGWVRNFGEFARYHFHFEGGLLETVPVIGLGRDESKLAQHRRKANIQDWFYLQPHLPLADALPYLISERGDPLPYERYLYAFRYINPHPERRLNKITVETLDADQETTFAILAITALIK